MRQQIEKSRTEAQRLGVQLRRNVGQIERLAESLRDDIWSETLIQTRVVDDRAEVCRVRLRLSAGEACRLDAITAQYVAVDLSDARATNEDRPWHWLSSREQMALSSLLASLLRQTASAIRLDLRSKRLQLDRAERALRGATLMRQPAEAANGLARV